MARRFALQAEVIGRVHQRPAEVPHPDPVGDDPCGERMLRRCDPVRQKYPALLKIIPGVLFAGATTRQGIRETGEDLSRR